MTAQQEIASGRRESGRVHQGPASGRPIEFAGGGAFHRELRTRVREVVEDPRQRRRAQRGLYLKGLVMLVWAGASWALLVFAAQNWWQAAALAVSLGLALAGIGFNITHDANHGSFSPHRWLNRTMRWSLDLIGGSSYVWRVKHNVVHHTFTNISGADGDIEQLPLMRLAPDQRTRWFHRFQHIYVWPLYGLFAVQWQLLGDVKQLRIGRVEGTALPWPRGRELLGFCLGKAVFLGWAVLVPLIARPVWQFALGFAIASFVMAVVLAVVFQLAHCIEEADFTTVEGMSSAGRVEWAKHQMGATVDFAPRNAVLTWYLGGLNFQIEHHLFSRVCHLHYPAMARIVREVCERHGVPYRVHDSFWGAVASHGRWLRRMGRPPARAGVEVVPAAR